MSNLGHCKDNDKSKAGLGGAPLCTFVTKNFMLLSNECLIVFYEERKMQKFEGGLEICRTLNSGQVRFNYLPYL